MNDRSSYRQHIVIDTRASPNSIRNAVSAQSINRSLHGSAVSTNIVDTTLDVGIEGGDLGIADLAAAPANNQGNKLSDDTSLSSNHQCHVDAEYGILNDYSESTEWDKIAHVQSRSDIRDPSDHVDAVTHSLSKTYQTIVSDMTTSRPGSGNSEALAPCDAEDVDVNEGRPQIHTKAVPVVGRSSSQGILGIVRQLIC